MRTIDKNHRFLVIRMNDLENTMDELIRRAERHLISRIGDIEN
jgi:hypothetical protein